MAFILGAVPALPAYPSLIHVSTGPEGKVAKDGHEQDWFQKWDGIGSESATGLKGGRLNFPAGDSLQGDA